jgi:hypothetical protein
MQSSRSGELHIQASNSNDEKIHSNGPNVRMESINLVKILYYDVQHAIERDGEIAIYMCDFIALFDICNKIIPSTYI